MLTLENIECKKNEQIIFAGLGFSLFLGSALIVSGKNGSGKTSLLKIVSGVYKESNGKILWSGENIENFRDDFNGDLQFIGHKNFLKQDLSVLDNLHFYAKLHDSEILIAAALRFFKLEDLAREKVKNLSAGWQKRVQLARLLACPATIWVLDEPSNNLDAEGKRLLKGLIETHLENSGVVVLATHDEEFFKLGSVICLEDFIYHNLSVRHDPKY